MGATPKPGDSGSSQESIVPMRLQKFLARAGVASRRGSENLMTAGRVAVNGTVVTELGSRVDPRTDVVTVDGNEVNSETGARYLVLNKPAGYLTTMDDPRGRPTVAELMPDDIPGLFPVGRLDMDTTGVLLLTTDGEMAHRLMHPSFHVDKVYHAKVEGVADERALDRLRSGIELEDGPTAPAEVRMIETYPEHCDVEVLLHEGRKRQVKRMLASLGHPVVTLHRTLFGPIGIENVAEGSVRSLEDEEVAALKRCVGMEGM